MKQALRIIERALAAQGRIDCVNFGACPGAYSVLCAVAGAEKDTTVYRRDGECPHAIDFVEVTVDGVNLRAQDRSRPATPDEIAALDRDDATDHRDEFRSARAR